MSYLTLNKRQSTGKLIAYVNLKDGSFVNLIKLDKPYKDGTKYAVIETTNNSFMSNGLYKDFNNAMKKYNLMFKNSKSIGYVSHGIIKSKEIENYINI